MRLPQISLIVHAHMKPHIPSRACAVCASRSATLLLTMFLQSSSEIKSEHTAVAWMGTLSAVHTSMSSLRGETFLMKPHSANNDT